MREIISLKKPQWVIKQMDESLRYRTFLYSKYILINSLLITVGQSSKFRVKPSKHCLNQVIKIKSMEKRQIKAMCHLL